jgi:hypothetical protein
MHPIEEKVRFSLNCGVVRNANATMSTENAAVQCKTEAQDLFARSGVHSYVVIEVDCKRGGGPFQSGEDKVISSHAINERLHVVVGLPLLLACMTPLWVILPRQPMAHQCDSINASTFSLAFYL